MEKHRNWRRWRRVLLIVGVLAVAGGIAVAAVNIHMIHSVQDRILTAEEAAAVDADCILVLGAGLRADGTPSLMLRDRIETGIDLYENGTAEKLLMSGDNSRVDYDEVSVMKNYAVEAGVPSCDVFRDHAGFSTYESMYRARDIFCARRVVIVTQEYHLYRALYVAEQLGLEAWGVAAVPEKTYGGQMKREVREIVARVKDYLYCIVQPEPTYLGEEIPVSGNADAVAG